MFGLTIKKRYVMRYNLYVVNDKLAQEAGPIFLAVNDAVALRQFKNLGIPEDLKGEYELLMIGYYDSKEIFITPEIYYSVVEEVKNEQ